MSFTRRRFNVLLGTAAAGSLAGVRAVRAEEKSISIGIVMPLTGAAAEDALNIQHGAVMAFEEAMARGFAGGMKINIINLDDGSATAGQYDPAQSATNARKLVVDKSVVAVVGPMNSGSGKAQAAIFSQGNLATVTPSSTNPDLTDPKFASLYRPAGLPIYFRTCATDAFQGPNMANYMSRELKVKSVFVIDDSGAYGVGLADAFQAQAVKNGMAVLGRDRVDPMASDYTALMTRIKGLNPMSLYCGSSALAGIKLVKQSYDIMPGIIKAAGDGLHQASILSGAGFPAVEGWYSTIAAPHMLDDKVVAPWIERFTKRFGAAPSDYAITAYDAGQVITAAIEAVAKTGAVVTRVNVRDAIQAVSVNTLQGPISFDANGDMTSHTVSVFQARLDPAYPPADIIHQFKYVGLAPSEST